MSGDETATAGGARSAPGVAIVASTRPPPIGRFVVLEVLGEGGMGVVYAAYDPTLDRKIAVKLVRVPVASSSAAADRERMLREARALARLTHPAILTVHDAGVIDDQVFIATELAGGGTLRAWQRAEARPWRALVAAYLEAGEGLAAAHDAGLVHRDFKPDNVLRTSDGRIRVADFGLAAPIGDGDRAIAGTPRYMAPEQHRGEVAGPAADQFAFCVALWEALTGAPPFPGDDRAAIAARIEAGPPAPAGPDVPPWLTAILARGLAPVATDRWPSMHALVAALADDPAVRRRRRWQRAAIALGAVALITLVIALAVRRRAAAAPTCEGGADRIAAVWSPARAAAVRARFVASGLPYAAAVADRVVSALDGRTAAWSLARRDACLATHATGEQSEQLLDRRMACLDRRLGELGALAGALENADRAIIDQAIQAIAVLPSIDACADVARLGEVTPPPADPASRAQIIDLFARIAAVAPGRAAMYRPAVVEAGYAALRALEPEVAALHHPPLDAALALRLAELAPPEAAEAHLIAAVRAAAEGHDDRAGATAWGELVRLVGTTLHRHGEAALLRTAAETASARAGVAASDDYDLLDGLARVANDAGDFAAARDLAAAAATAAERLLPTDDPQVATYLSGLATAERFAGNLDEALRLQRRALELYGRTLGADHPGTVYAQELIVTVLGLMGRADEALALAQDLRARTPALLGADHPFTGAAHHVLANLLSDLGRNPEALAELQAARAIYERAHGPDGTETLNLRTELAWELFMAGRVDDATAEYRAIVAGLERTVGPEHPRVAQALLDLATTLLEPHPAEARPLLERATRIFEARLGPEHPMLVGVLRVRGQLELVEGHPAAALPWIDRATAISERTHGANNVRTALTRYDRVLALWDLGRRADARALAIEVAATLRALPTGAGRAAAVERWIAAHR